MGGIQRIFCGDFLQLPPIANSRSDDVGEPCVLSPEFGKYMPHKIILEQVRFLALALKGYIKNQDFLVNLLHLINQLFSLFCLVKTYVIFILLAPNCH